ncbi:MAG TPA: hypothetical protein VK966_02835 [Longimicrobiales bacterium]|nr:hypothetical protein [Longimicrobiales bacterium]
MRTLRTTLVALTLVALPTLTVAQESTDLTEPAPSAALEISVDRPDFTAPDLQPVDLATERDVEDRDALADDEAAAQDLGDRGFWKIVLAVVIGGVILAVLL